MIRRSVASAASAAARPSFVVARSKDEIRSWRRVTTGSIGFVPTMGALHAGHMSLVARAMRENAHTVASIYVNPTQFAAHEDLSKYPRTEAEDLAMLRSAGADGVFIPSGSLYEADSALRIVWKGIESVLREAEARPGHFEGVMTVCSKLFNLVQPTRVYVGAKDAAQCIVLTRMVRELDMPLDLIVCDTLRESDGLAMSSRNRYLSADDRRRATVISRALFAAQALVQTSRGAATLGQVDDVVRQTLSQERALQIEYVSLANLATGAELVDRSAPVSGRVLVSFAGRIGTTRLIDNVVAESSP